MTLQDVYNVFCPTGEGGGIDASCGGDGGGNSESNYAAKFNGNGSEFKFRADEEQGKWDVVFEDINESVALTGKHGTGAVAVMRAAGSALDKFVQEKKPKTFEFGSATDEPSRVRLYDKVAKVIGERHNYSVERRPTKFNVYYTFTRNSSVRNLSRSFIDDWNRV